MLAWSYVGRSEFTDSLVDALRELNTNKPKMQKHIYLKHVITSYRVAQNPWSLNYGLGLKNESITILYGLKIYLDVSRLVILEKLSRDQDGVEIPNS